MFEGAARIGAGSAKTLLWDVIDLSGRVTIRLCLVLLVFALADIVYSRWQFLRGLRMSRREQEDELKHRDGDPRIKARLRELRRELQHRMRAVGGVRNADVLVVNPTHIAVALRYEYGAMPAPQVVAKGAGSLAGKMREVAYRAGVPIVPNPQLARSLYREVALDGYLPERWYAQAAKILVWVQATRRKSGKVR